MNKYIICFVLLSAFIFSIVSCNRAPGRETIRLYVHASEVYSQGMFGETSKILRAENHFPPALLLRAKAEYFSGDFEKAEKSCRRLLRIRPSSNEGKYYLARIMYENGESAIAAGLTESILTDFPHDIRTLRLAAEIASETGRRDEAVILLDRAAEFSAENALVLLDRARLRWTAGKKHDALEDLSRARAMLPWDTPLSRSINNLEKTIKEAL